MKIFEPHIHMYSRTTDDYEKMALAGITAILEPAFWLGQERKRAGTFLDYFDSLVNFEVERARKYGIDHYCTLALNPKEANNEKLANEVLAALKDYLHHPRVVGVGEVGFDSITPAEERAFRKQIELAAEAKLPVLIHTPHVDKRRGTEQSLRVARESGYPEAMFLVDHNNEETTGLVKATRCWAGHTVYPVTKLSPERAVNLLVEHGVERMLVNSSADWGPSDVLSVPKTAFEMRRRGFSEADVDTVVWQNPVAFFGQSGRLKVG
ncbi:MAG: TatD family hydrolase [Planctomycetota bacterium]